MPYEEVQKVFRYIDTNSNGIIEYEEFCELMEENWRRKDPYQVYQ